MQAEQGCSVATITAPDTRNSLSPVNAPQFGSEQKGETAARAAVVGSME